MGHSPPAAIVSRNLPKVDTFGKCDPFIKLQHGSDPPVQTEVVKNVFEAFFEEKFGFDTGSEAAPIEGAKDGGDYAKPLKVEVWDWNAVSASDLLGVVTIPATKIQEVRGVLRWRRGGGCAGRVSYCRLH